MRPNEYSGGYGMKMTDGFSTLAEDSAVAADFADLVYVSIDNPPSLAAVSKWTLNIYTQADMPIAQQWLGVGDVATLPDPVDPAILVPPGSSDVDPSLVSVVICTRDRPDELRRCLASFQHQTMSPGEIIVVDNASRTPDTREVALAAGATYVREDRPGLDFARNCGARAAQGAFILYTDDDTQLHPRWIENCVAAFGDDPAIAAVTGLVLPAALQTEAQWLFEMQWSFGRGFERVDYGPEFYHGHRRWGCPAWQLGAGANMAFRRSLFDAIGYFDERLDVGAAGCSGDSEFWYRLLAAGYTCRYEPTAIVSHYHRLTMDGLSSQIYHYMRGFTAALMVQFERTGDRGNLWWGFVRLPKYFLRRIAGRIIKGPTQHNRMLLAQMRGALSGFLFYMRTPRPDNGR